MSTEQAQQSAIAYRGRRKNPNTVLVAAIVGLVAVAGFQRFWLGQIGMGFLYLCTVGLFVVGTVVDLVSYKRLAFTHNQRVAQQIATNIGQLEASGGLKTGTSSDGYRRDYSHLSPQESL
jgi:TM2 domain-containing membrane protein YozV